MAASALIKFTQGLNVGPDGEALLGEVGTDVYLSNVDNTDVASWQFDLAYADPGSALYVDVGPDFDSGSSSTPATQFWPDVPGSYRWVLKVWNVPDMVGDPSSVDIRVFSVSEANGLIVPPPQLWPLPLPDPQSADPLAKPNEMNFGGQPFGWAGQGVGDGLQGEVVRTVDELRGLFTLHQDSRAFYVARLSDPAALQLGTPELPFGTIQQALDAVSAATDSQLITSLAGVSVYVPYPETEPGGVVLTAVLPIVFATVSALCADGRSYILQLTPVVWMSSSVENLGTYFHLQWEYSLNGADWFETGDPSATFGNDTPDIPIDVFINGVYLHTGVSATVQFRVVAVVEDWHGLWEITSTTGSLRVALMASDRSWLVSLGPGQYVEDALSFSVDPFTPNLSLEIRGVHHNLTELLASTLDIEIPPGLVDYSMFVFTGFRAYGLTVTVVESGSPTAPVEFALADCSISSFDLGGMFQCLATFRAESRLLSAAGGYPQHGLGYLDFIYAPNGEASIFLNGMYVAIGASAGLAIVAKDCLFGAAAASIGLSASVISLINSGFFLNGIIYGLTCNALELDNASFKKFVDNPVQISPAATIRALDGEFVYDNYEVHTTTSSDTLFQFDTAFLPDTMAIRTKFIVDAFCPEEVNDSYFEHIGLFKKLSGLTSLRGEGEMMHANVSGPALTTLNTLALTVTDDRYIVLSAAVHGSDLAQRNLFWKIAVSFSFNKGSL